MVVGITPTLHDVHTDVHMGMYNNNDLSDRLRTSQSVQGSTSCWRIPR